MDEAERKEKETEAAVAAAVLAVKFTQLRIEVDELWRWKKDNEAVILWVRGFQDNYRKTMSVILASGAVALIGFLLQAYYTINKSK